MTCCVEEITPDGWLIPFCAYDSVGYCEAVRAQLSGVAVPTDVPNTVGLAPVPWPTAMRESKYVSKQVRSSMASLTDMTI
jgi:hypothetical protein